MSANFLTRHVPVSRKRKTLRLIKMLLVYMSERAGVHRAGCSKRPSSKAAASEEARRTLRYVEPLSDARTPLVGFFSILSEVAVIDDLPGIVQLIQQGSASRDIQLQHLFPRELLQFHNQRP